MKNTNSLFTRLGYALDAFITSKYDVNDNGNSNANKNEDEERKAKIIEKFPIGNSKEEIHLLDGYYTAKIISAEVRRSAIRGKKLFTLQFEIIDNNSAKGRIIWHNFLLPSSGEDGNDDERMYFPIKLCEFLALCKAQYQLGYGNSWEKLLWGNKSQMSFSWTIRPAELIDLIFIIHITTCTGGFGPHKGEVIHTIKNFSLPL